MQDYLTGLVTAMRVSNAFLDLNNHLLAPLLYSYRVHIM